MKRKNGGEIRRRDVGKAKGRRVLVTRKRGRKRFEDCDSIENSLRSVDPWGRIGRRQWKESFSLMTKPKWLPLIWPNPPPHFSAPAVFRAPATVFIGWPRKTMDGERRGGAGTTRNKEGRDRSPVATGSTWSIDTHQGHDWCALHQRDRERWRETRWFLESVRKDIVVLIVSIYIRVA